MTIPARVFILNLKLDAVKPTSLFSKSKLTKLTQYFKHEGDEGHVLNFIFETQIPLIIDLGNKKNRHLKEIFIYIIQNL